MIPTQTVPVTVSPEARQYMAEEGLQGYFEKIVRFLQQSERRVGEIRVTLEPVYEEPPPCVLVEALMEQPLASDDRTEEEWVSWRAENFPPEVFLQFYLLPRHG